MKNIVNTYVDRFRNEKRTRMRLIAILVALAAVVTVVVFWQLHYTGIAMTNEVYCGMEEHQHDASCYEEVLVCGLEESDDVYDEDGNLVEAGHVHTDDCYVTQLTCGLEEHTHTIDCMVDETADVETEVDWEATIPDKLDGTPAENLIAVAQSQVGYTESEHNFQLDEDGETKNGYTRYGAWYGNEYGEWNAMFAAFCLNYAGLSDADFPVNSGAEAWTVDLKKADMYADASDYTPQAGDLIFLDTDADGKTDAVDIIEDIETELDEEIGENVISKIYTVEGDFEDAVSELAYTVDSDADALDISKVEVKADSGKWTAVSSDTLDVEKVSIIGYGVLPEEVETEVSDETTLTYEGEDYIVTVTYGPDAELPEEVELVVSEYDRDSEIYQNRMEEAAELNGWDEDMSDYTRLFNIGLYVLDENGEQTEIEPAAPVEVSIDYLDGSEEEISYQVTHFGDEAEQVDAASSSEDGTQSIKFALDSFSDIAVTALSDDYGIALADSNPEEGNFDFLSSFNVSQAGWNEDGTKEVEENTFYKLTDANSQLVSSEYLLDMSSENASVNAYQSIEEDTSSALLSFDGTYLLLDVSSLGTDSEIFDENVSGSRDEGSRFSDVGTLMIKNAESGKYNIEIDIDDVYLYNSYADQFVDYSSSDTYKAPPLNNKLCIGRFDGNKLWVGYTFEHHTDGSTHDYACNMDLNMTITIYDAKTGIKVDDSFLMVASDIDTRSDSEIDGKVTKGTVGQWGYFAETFKTLSGFNGSYYIFDSDHDNINADKKGKVTIQATETTMLTEKENEDGSVTYTCTGVVGDASYTEAGIYGVTETGSWSVGYSTSMCATEVEIYDYTMDLNILKYATQDEDSDENLDVLSNVKFEIYKYVTETVDNSSEEVKYYYHRDEGSNITSWDSDENNAYTFTTDTDGKIHVKDMAPGTYYLKELKSDENENFVIPDYIEFTISPFGDITTTADKTVAVVKTLEEDGEDIIYLVVYNSPITVLPLTGSIGSAPYTIGGLLVIAAAAICLVYTYKRRKGGAIH